MLCKKCTHYYVCGHIENNVAECSHFIDNDTVINLPCPMNSPIYIIVTKRPKYNFPEFKFVKDSKLTFYNLERVMEEFGKTIFLSRAEAQKVLKEGDVDA